MKMSIVPLFLVSLIGFAFPAHADVASPEDAGIAAPVAPAHFEEVPDMCLADCTQAFETLNDACLEQFHNCLAEEQVRVNPPKVTPDAPKKPKAPKAPKASPEKVENFKKALAELEARLNKKIDDLEEKLRKEFDSKLAAELAAAKKERDDLDARVGKLEKRADANDQKNGEQDGRLDAIDTKIGEHDKKLAEHDKAIGNFKLLDHDVGVMMGGGLEGCVAYTRQVSLTDLPQIDENGNTVGNDGTLVLHDPLSGCLRPTLELGLRSKSVMAKISGSPFGLTVGSAQAPNGDPAQVFGWGPNLTAEVLGIIPDTGLAVGVYGGFALDKVNALPSGKASLDAYSYTGGLAADWTFARFGSMALALSARVGGGYAHLSTGLPTGAQKWWPALALDGSVGLTGRFDPFQVEAAE